MKLNKIFFEDVAVFIRDRIASVLYVSDGKTSTAELRHLGRIAVRTVCQFCKFGTFQLNSLYTYLFQAVNTADWLASGYPPDPLRLREEVPEYVHRQREDR